MCKNMNVDGGDLHNKWIFFIVPFSARIPKDLSGQGIATCHEF